MRMIWNRKLLTGTVTSKVAENMRRDVGVLVWPGDNLQHGKDWRHKGMANCQLLFGFFPRRTPPGALVTRVGFCRVLCWVRLCGADSFCYSLFIIHKESAFIRGFTCTIGLGFSLVFIIPTVAHCPIIASSFEVIRLPAVYDYCRFIKVFPSTSLCSIGSQRSIDSIQSSVFVINFWCSQWHKLRKPCLF